MEEYLAQLTEALRDNAALVQTLVEIYLLGTASNHAGSCVPCCAAGAV